NGIRSLIERSVPSGTDTAITDSVFEEFRSYYKAHSAEKTRPYDGVIDMLNRLRTRGIRLAVLSNKADFAVQALCEKYFPGIFDYAAGEKPDIPRKPEPDAVNAILSEFSIPREDAVYIGDSDVDIETARNASMDCISVTWGFRDESILAAHGAACVAHNVQELESAILK
ncbi:MAG: HAD family hydrolase, partial [Clostridia bacterium]|nr:HAD family hydrolase [Clostridia bacterium]